MPLPLPCRRHPEVEGGGGDGFGKKKRPKWETRPYVAEPVGDGWISYIKAEMDDAICQNNDRDISSEGIAIVVSNTGEIVKRGLGKVSFYRNRDDVNSQNTVT